ncbi:MAG: hypothetical protein K1X36_15800 [Pyrinomonadaceae bacterium]|nr:hypothetical protein [Pyrinomonadaceae bacterium]
MEIFIPGRIEFLGKHTDYCGGRSIVCAIDRGFRAVVEERSDRMLEVESLDTGESISLDLTANTQFAAGHWGNYAAETASRLTRNFAGAITRGATVRFTSDLPKAAGLSSSSALMIMVFAALASVNRIDRTAVYKQDLPGGAEIAEYLGCIENGCSFRSLAGSSGVGTFGGSQDHAAILLGNHDRLSMFSFGPLRPEAEFAFPSELAFVVASSGVVAEKTGDARERYNRVSRMVTELTASFGGETTLRTLIDERGPDAVLEATGRGKFSFPAGEMAGRAEQFYAENYEIIPAVAERLAAGRFEKIGEHIDRSQLNAERLLGNQVPETVFLQAAAREMGAIAASAFGAGFGGSVYALVPTRDAEWFCGEWRRRYHERWPQYSVGSSFFVTRPSRAELPGSFLIG